MGLFSRDDAAQTNSLEITVISEGISIFGEIAAMDNVYINGTFTGKIVARGEIAVGPKGKLQGQIQAASIRVAGLVDGNVECGALSVLPTGKVYGHLSSATLELHPGGFLDAEHQLRAATMSATPQATVTAKPSEERDAVVTPLHTSKETPWALKKPRVPTFRNTQNAAEHPAQRGPASGSNRDNGTETPTGPVLPDETQRWHGSRNHR